MRVAILGHGVEGQSVERYFAARGAEVRVYDHIPREQLPSLDLSGYDLVFRSPSVPPACLWGDHTVFTHEGATPEFTSVTQYFFQHCPAPIIGVTGTKGKGTTCTLIQAILEQILKSRIHLVGNIGTPALDVLSQIQPQDVVIYELSSFQLWDLQRSPQVAVVLRIEPDHLDVHPDYADYLAAKAHICEFQGAGDCCVYFSENTDSAAVAERSLGIKLPYPSIVPQIAEKVNSLTSLLPLPGQHNRENAEAALLAAYAYCKQSGMWNKQSIKPAKHSGMADKPSGMADDQSRIAASAASAEPPATDFASFLDFYHPQIAAALEHFHGLPHRLEFVRELNCVKYYDDNFSSAYPAMEVAIKAFAGQPTILIAGGKDRGLDLRQHKQAIFYSANVKKAILIGETATALAAGEDPDKYELADSLEEAVAKARAAAEASVEIIDSCMLPKEQIQRPSVVVMSPGAASFDMFKDFKDRGEQFTRLVKELK